MQVGITFLTLILLLANPVFPCRMLGVIALPGESLGGLDSLHNFHPYLLEELEELRLQGGSGSWPYNNRDGWAMTSFSTSESAIQVQAVRSEMSAFDDEMYYQQAFTVLSPEMISILMGHLRQSTSGAEGIQNPHPFIFTDSTGQHFSFAHNGDMDKDELRVLVGNDWLEDHPPQTYGEGPWDGDGWDAVVDSELFFFWIMKNIEEWGNIEIGIQQALIILENEAPGEIKNFLFTDGVDLYGYRSSPAADICYFDGSNELEPPWYLELSNHRAIMSTPPPTGDLALIPWIELSNKYLVILKADGSTEVLDVLDLSEIPESDNIPTRSELIKAYPNPFNGSTIIPAQLDHTGDLELAIYNTLGQVVFQTTLFNAQAGSHRLRWKGQDDQGRQVESGTYFFTVSGSQQTSNGKLLLLK
ncbi:MAG: FlgD immunoglobulin-like domain containing protein [Candidatus Marinimicrobia bacterium]|nr:FlgD immunoglobulin-like domain containing protein [Candidatus Neomarinimicrobiota bacterium]